MRSINKATLSQSAETHRANIRKSLEHRLEVARAAGNQELIRALEAEYQQFA